jgi:hypothetical protein
VWTSSNVFDKLYDRREQEDMYYEEVKIYKSEKATYDAFCEEKLVQLPAVKHQMTREAIQ